MIDVEIDQGSGFCFGVVNAIKKAEQELEVTEDLYCLGDIVHNSLEVERLRRKGLKTIDYSQMENLCGQRVLFRAHGEPPEVYKRVRKLQLQLIDATCPVVLGLQGKIRRKYLEQKEQGQIVIFGKKGHAEVNGLVGQTDGHAIVLQNREELDVLDFKKDIYLFSQTTMSISDYHALAAEIEKRIMPSVSFEWFDTICRQVSNRMEKLRDFALSKDVIYFVAGEKSSNGKVLYQHCLAANPQTFFISSPEEVVEPLSPKVKTVGICGATSTPKWLMEEVAERIKILNI